MEQYACGFRPFLIISLTTSLKIDEPVEIRLKVMDIHTDEAPYVSFEPGTHVVDQGYVFQIIGIFAVGLVYLRSAAKHFDQPIMGKVPIMDDQ